MRTKEGQLGHNELMYLVKIILTFVVFLVFTLLIRSHVSTEVTTQKTEADVLFYRFLYSPNGISYYDEGIDRLYPGVIDLGKMLDREQIQSHLQDVVSYAGDDGSHIGARFKLFNATGSEIMTFYFDENDFKRMYPLSFGGKGPGTSRRTEHSLYVLLHNEDILEKREELSNMSEAKRSRFLERQTYNPKNMVQGKLVTTIVTQQE